MNKIVKQTHYGTGDNIGGDKVSTYKKIENKISDIPTWLKYVVAIVTIGGFIWAIYIYFFPIGY